MSIYHFVLLFLAFLSIQACKNSNSIKKTSTSNQQIDTRDKRSTTTPDLTKYGIANNPENVLGGLKVGDKAPDFKLLDQDGKENSLETTLMEGPVLLVFLRAEWCSFCVRHLQEFQKNIQEINETGLAKVIAISPQQRSYMQKFHKDNQLSFPILYDEEHSVMKNYKVFFHVTEKYNHYIEKAKGNTIEVFNGDSIPVMPIPATYLINQDKTIQYVHYDPDYKKRSDVMKVITQL